MCKEVEKKQHYHIGPRMRRLDNVLKRNMILSLKGQGMDEVTAMNSFFIGYLYSRKGEAVYQRDLEREFKIGRSSVTNILNRMEEKGFVKREVEESDARLKRLSLTPKGEEQQQIIRSTLGWLSRKQIEGISEEELDSCYATLAKVFRNAEAINELVTGPDESWRREVAANPGDDWDCRHRKENETS